MSDMLGESAKFGYFYNDGHLSKGVIGIVGGKSVDPSENKERFVCINDTKSLMIHKEARLGDIHANHILGEYHSYDNFIEILDHKSSELVLQSLINAINYEEPEIKH